MTECDTSDCIQTGIHPTSRHNQFIGFYFERIVSLSFKNLIVLNYFNIVSLSGQCMIMTLAHQGELYTYSVYYFNVAILVLRLL